MIFKCPPRWCFQFYEQIFDRSKWIVQRIFTNRSRCHFLSVCWSCSIDHNTITSMFRRIMWKIGNLFDKALSDAFEVVLFTCSIGEHVWFFLKERQINVTHYNSLMCKLIQLDSKICFTNYHHRNDGLTLAYFNPWCPTLNVVSRPSCRITIEHYGMGGL